MWDVGTQGCGMWGYEDTGVGQRGHMGTQGWRGWRLRNKGIWGHRDLRLWGRRDVVTEEHGTRCWRQLWGCVGCAAGPGRRAVCLCAGAAHPGRSMAAAGRGRFRTAGKGASSRHHTGSPAATHGSTPSRRAPRQPPGVGGNPRCRHGTAQLGTPEPTFPLPASLSPNAPGKDPSRGTQRGPGLAGGGRGGGAMAVPGSEGQVAEAQGGAAEAQPRRPPRRGPGRHCGVTPGCQHSVWGGGWVLVIPPTTEPGLPGQQWPGQSHSQDWQCHKQPGSPLIPPREPPQQPQGTTSSPRARPVTTTAPQGNPRPPPGTPRTPPTQGSPNDPRNPPQGNPRPPHRTPDNPPH